MKSIAALIALAVLFAAAPAEAKHHRHHRHHHHRHHHHAPHRSHRHHRGNHHAHRSIIPRHATIAYPTIVPHGLGEIGEAIAKPIRFIAGSLVCALNVNAALAERGIRGTGSALAHSFDSWGARAAFPVPGAVAVMDRRGGGHVAMVSRVTADGRVFYWNATGGQRDWREIEIRGRSVRYRVASGGSG